MALSRPEMKVTHISAMHHHQSKLGFYPFHAVSGRDLPKLLVIAEHREICRVAEFRVVSCSAEVELPRFHRGKVEAGARMLPA